MVQGLAAHINANAKKLRKAFVDHKGKKDIGLDNSRGQYGDFSKADCKWQVCAITAAEKLRRKSLIRNTDGFTKRILIQSLP